MPTTQRFLLAALFLSLSTCKTAPTTRQTAETMTDAAVTQAKIDRADELAEEMKTAPAGPARDTAVKRYIDASKDALAASERTINNLRESLINSETARGELQIKLTACQTDADKYGWLKWFLIIGGPVVLIGAFLLGRKTA